MKIIEVVEKQDKNGKTFWNITVEGGEGKYANWFDIPAPTVGMTEFEMIRGKEYTDKQGKQRNYWNARPDRLSALEKRVKELEVWASGVMPSRQYEEPTALANSQYRDASPQPDEMNGDPLDEEAPF